MSDQTLFDRKSDDLEAAMADEWNLEFTRAHIRCGVHTYPVGMIKRVYLEELETEIGLSIVGLGIMLCGGLTLANALWGNLIWCIIFGALSLVCAKGLWNVWERMNHRSVWIQTGTLPVNIFVGPQEQAEAVKAKIEKSLEILPTENSQEGQ